MDNGIWLYAKIGTGSAEWIARVDKDREPRVREFLIVRRPEPGTKEIHTRCTKIVYLGDTENLFLLELM